LQDNSNLRRPHRPKKKSAKGKCIYPNTIPHPKNKMPAKTHFSNTFIHLIHKACQILCTFTIQCHCLHLHSQCLHRPHTHSLHSTTYHQQSHPLQWIYILTYLLTYSTEHSPSGEANQFSASQEIPHILWNLKVHYHIHKCLPPVPISASSIQSITPHPTS